MTTFTDLLDSLVAYEARLKATSDLARPIRAKLAVAAVEKYQEEGSDRWVRPGAVVSLVKPSPWVEVTAPETLCDWLEASGHAGLVTERVEVLDHSRLAKELRRLLDVDVDDRLVNAVDVKRALEQTVDIRRSPVSDFADHLDYTAAPDGTLVTPEGELIPGCRFVRPEPRTVSVRVDKDLREASAVLVADELGVS